MRRILLLFAFLFIGQYSFAQEAPEYVNVNLVQPDVWQIPGLPEAGVDAGGDLNLSIPVMTVPGRGLNYNISFSYNSNITLRQQASWLGLGWSFDPGSITREPSGGGVASTAADPSVLHYYGIDTFDTETGNNRVQPDVYYLSIPGRGTVQFTQSNKTGFLSQSIPSFSDNDFFADEHRSWKIEGFKFGSSFKSCDIDDGDGDGINTGTGDGQCNISVVAGSRKSTSADDYHKFVVTTDDGTRYVYEAPTLAAFKTAETVMGTNPSLRQNYVNTWRLRAILSTRYAGPDIPRDFDEGQWIRFEWSGVYYGKLNDENDFSETRFLKTIVTPTHKAEIGIAPRHEENLSTFISANRVPDTDNYLYQRLEKIDLKRRSTGALVRSVELVQNKGEFGPGLTFDKKRLGLTVVKFLDSNSNEQYRFAMEYDCDIEFGGFDLWEMDDDFGFLKPGATSLSGCSTTTQPNVWRLTKLTYPSGGTESYNYEFDTITQFATSTHIPKYSVWELGDPSAIVNTYSLTGKDNYGGSRISQITRKDGVNGPDISTTYDYGWGYVTGVPHLEPVLESSGAPLYVPSSRAKTRVSYASVTRNSGGNGSVETSYTTSASHGGVDLVSTGALKIDGGLTATIIMQGNEDWNWGREYKQIVKAEDGDLIQIVETDLNFTRGKQSAKIYFTPFEVHSTYVQSRIDSITKTDCGANVTVESNCNAAHTTTFDYHEETIGGVQTTTNQVVSTTETSQDITIINNTKFAHEIYTDASTGMRGLNMLTQIYSSELKDGSGSTQQKNWTLWDTGLALLMPTSIAEVWLPGEEWIWGGVNTGTVPNSLDDQVYTYKEYTEDALILKGTDAAGTTTTYTWSHERALPTVISSNTSSGGTLTTTATYDNDKFLMKSLTGPDGVATHFSYDAFGRLKTIKENAGDATAIAEYNYEIKGASISSSNPNYIETILNSSNAQKSRTYFDGLGRPIQTQIEETDSTVVTAIDYNDQGREHANWVPYRKNGFSFDSNHGNVGGSWGTAQSYHDMANPYVRNFYRTDPLSRLDKLEFEGAFSAQPAEFDYGTGSIGGDDYLFVLNEDENNNQVKTFTDTFGNTKKIESPEGAVTEFTYNALSLLTQVTNKSVNGTDQHTFYDYDVRGRLIEKSTPDADGDDDGNPDDETNSSGVDFEYRYDISGNLRFLRDPVRRDDGNHYLYYRYDGHNRLIEEGIHKSSSGFDSDVDVNNATFPTNNTEVKTNYNYSGAQLDIVTFYDKNGNSSTYNYDYDNRGRIDKITANLNGLAAKTIAYEYDLQGRVTKMLFEDSKTDHFYHWYNYDEAGRLELVEVGVDNNQNVASEAATYDYWPNGQVRTLKLGDSSNPVQTVDYHYNIRGWLKMINDPNNLTDSGSLGGDAFGLELAYEDNTEPWLNGGDFFESYNGNVASAMWATNVSGQTGGSQMGYVFEYDGLNRLTKAESHQNDGGWNNGSLFDVPTISYDEVGNILTLLRKDDSGIGTSKSYSYNTGSNWLTSLTNHGSFSYDPNGNIISGELTEDVSSTLTYDHRNLPETITAGGTTFTYRYDAGGQRIYSSADPSYYIRGAGGEVVAVYDGTGTLRYWNLLAGSEVIGRQVK